MAKKQGQRLIPEYLLKYTEELQKNHEDPSAEWGGGGGSPIEAGTGIDITGDETKTISIDETVALKSELFSGDYDDLTDKPDLTVYATKNELNGYIKDNDTNYASTFRGKGVYVKEEGQYTTTIYGDGTISRSIPRTAGYTYTLPSATGTLALTSDIPDVSEFVTETTLTAVLADYELKSEAFSGNYNDLTNKPDLSIYAESADLATVATSGSYNDLIDKPTIPSIPVTDVEVNGVSVLSGTVAEVTVPTDTSDLTNGAGFITSSAIPTNVSSFTNDANYVTSASLTAELANYVPSSSITTVAYTGSYNDLTDKPAIPTATSDLTNDSGFITGITSGDVTTALGYTPTNPSSLATVATSGSYNDLTDKPSIPDVTHMVTDNTTQEITGIKGFTGNKRIRFFDNNRGTQKMGFTCYHSAYDNSATPTSTYENGYLESTYQDSSFSNSPSMVLGMFNINDIGKPRYLGFKYESDNGYTYRVKHTLMMPITGSDDSVRYFPWAFTDGTPNNWVYADTAGMVDISPLLPTVPTATSDLTNDSGFITSSDLPTYAINETTHTAVSGVSSSTVSVINSATLTQATETLTFTYDDDTTASFTFLTANTALSTGTTDVVSAVSSSTITAVTGTTLTVS